MLDQDGQEEAVYTVGNPFLEISPERRAIMQSMPPVLNPKTYTSPSGEYALYINPSSSVGSGGATYRLSRKGKILWQGQRPFTLWKAGVSDAGIAGGFAYYYGQEGWGGPERRDGYGTFDVVILSASGAVRLHQRVVRKGSRFIHASPSPIGAGVIVDGGNDRMVIRVADEDLNRGEESWWVYKLSTGKKVSQFAPKRFMARSSEPARSILDAQAVPGTPLTLLHWWRFGEGYPGNMGALFTLIDLAGKPVWQFELRRDYNIPGNENAEDKLRESIRSTGAILDTQFPGRFTLHFVAAKKRVTFTASSVAGDKWHISEIRREAYVPTPEKQARFDAPVVRLKPIDKIELRVPGSQAPHPIRRVFQLVAAGPQRFAFIRREDPAVLVVVNNRGEAIHTLSLDKIPQKEGDNISRILWRGGTRFLTFVERRSGKLEERSTEAYDVDARTGTVAKLAGFRCPYVGSVAGFSDGGFVVLATVQAKYTSKDEVYAYDVTGKRTWALTRDFGYGPNEGPEMLFSPESLAVLTDGSVAVLDNIKHSVQLYNRTGRYIKTILLDKAWGRDADYPTDIIADTQGGFIVHDYPGSPSVVWMNTQGAVLKGYIPRYVGGGRIENPEIVMSPEGNLWVTDSYSLLRLDIEGHVVERLGDGPSAADLGTISELLIRPNGRILAADQRTRSVHVFDANGRWLHVCAPQKGAQEAPGLSLDLQKPLQPGPGDSFVMDNQWFDASGKSRPKPVGFRTPSERIEKISRRPDGTWRGYTWEFTSAPSGALAFVDNGGGRMRKNEYMLSLYSPADAPEHLIRLPSFVSMSPTVAYDGKRVVFVGDRRVYACRPDGKPLWQCPTPPAKDPEGIWYPFLTEGGRILCLFDGQRTVYRFVMP